MSKTWSQIAGDCASSAFAASRRYEEAKEMFAAVTNAYKATGTTGREILDAESRAATDPRRIKAVGDAGFHRDECIMYTGLAQLALAMVEHNKEDNRNGFGAWEETYLEPVAS